MHARVTRSSASVGSSIVASAMSSTRTSPAPYMSVAFMENASDAADSRHDGHEQGPRRVVHGRRVPRPGRDLVRVLSGARRLGPFHAGGPNRVAHAPERP